jgi:hypothetical protein
MSEAENFAEDLRQDLERESLRASLRAAYKDLAKAKNRNETLAEAAFEGARDALVAIGRPKIRPYKTVTKRGKDEVALWHLTDWQGAKVTTSYDSNVMVERVGRFVERATDITNIQRQDHDVTKCNILIGGDMGEGLFNFPTQPFEIDATIFDQFVRVASLLDKTARAARQLYDEVEVVCEWGNHGRIGSKRSAVPRADNFDRMIYRLAQEMSKDVPDLSYNISEEDIQRVEIGNYRALLIHGDEIGRNGFASPMTIVQHANRWRSGAYRWEFRDIYMGHYHTHAEWPLANGLGAVYQTGSTESDNRYARDNLASSAIPSQRLHFIDPRKGRVSAQYKIMLEE